MDLELSMNLALVMRDGSRTVNEFGCSEGWI